MQPTVGIIGLGLMGKPMALNLLKAGFPLVVWNRTRTRTDEVVKAGARLAASPRDAASQADVLITMVSDPPAVEEVLWGKEAETTQVSAKEGALDGLRRGAVLVDSSTVSPELARREAAACAERSVDFLDAPVTGGTWGAENGELVFMVGGAAETLKRVEPVLAAMGKRWYHLGPHGAGQTIKLATNMILSLEVQALAEALTLVVAAGIPAEKLLDVMQSSMGRAPVLDVKAPLMLKQDYKPSFPLRLMHKDMGLALQLASELSLPLPAGLAAYETYDAVKRSAKEDLDYAAVALFWQQR